jgi:hypothetical protein
VKDVQDMTDEEYRLYKLRRFAASMFRGAGLDAFSEQVERGELDNCKEMLVAAFFIDQPEPNDQEFSVAWSEAAAQVDCR